MLLGGQLFVIIGVAASKFDLQDFGPAAEVWVPLQIDPNTPDQGHFNAAGRLKNGVTLAQAKARLDASAAAYAVPASVRSRWGRTRSGSSQTASSAARRVLLPPR
jgi:hypothetical protein